MSDPFALWRLPWSASSPAAVEPGWDFPVLTQVRLDLPTMVLRESVGPRKGGMPTLIVGPYALHDASIADFSAEHSLAAVLQAELGSLALTHWKSATADMRLFTIDTYLADLNVAIDDLGGRVALVGLCQGGWLALAYAARFPDKVSALVLAGSPVDLEAGSSQITRCVAMTMPEVLAGMVSMGGGRVIGSLALPFWTHGLQHPKNAAASLQLAEVEPGLFELFAAWHRRTVDLPGPYFLQTTEWLFRENRLARNLFVGLGRICNLETVTAPIFVLAAEDDEIVDLKQSSAVARLCAHVQVELRVVPGTHLSLFLGRSSLTTAWQEVAAWLLAPGKPVGRRRRKGSAA